MPVKKKITVKQLEKLIEKWDAYIPQCITYRDSLVAYRDSIVSGSSVGTTPPGKHPKQPPGLQR